MDLLSTFAENLKYYRIKKKYSQEELAFKANLHRTYISALECKKRNISIENISKIADALEVEPFKLMKKRGNNYDQKKW